MSPIGDPQLYASTGYALVPGWIGEGMADYFSTYLLQLDRLGRLHADPAIVGSVSLYGDPAFDVFLEVIREEVSTVVGADLLPTYSFARVYGPGSSLHRHRDRASCEHSVSLMLGASDPEPWPLWLATDEGVEVPIPQAPGDAVCYQGGRLTHWRDPLPSGWHAQLFLHYVDADGPYAHFERDQRAELGMPANDQRDAEPEQD